MNKVSDFLPWGVCGLAVLYLGVSMVQPSYRKDAMQLGEFARLPVTHNGRVKPLDSLARISLMQISGRQTFRDENDRRQPAIKWLLDVMTTEVLADLSVDSEAARYPIFRINDPEVLNLLGLKARDGFFSYAEFAPKLLDLRKDAKSLHQHRNLASLLFQFNVYAHLASGPAAKYKVFRIENDQVLAVLDLKPRKGLRYSIEEFLPKAGLFWDYFEGLKEGFKPRDLFEEKMMELVRHVGTYLHLARGMVPHAVPPLREGQEWQPLADVPRQHPAVQAYDHLFIANARQDAELFNATLQAYGKFLQEKFHKEMARTRFETFYNHFSPFYHSSVLYGAVFLLICLSWFGYPGPLLRSAFWLCGIVAVVHTLALIFRIYLMGRPPVTNLYSSAIFIGWGAVLLCLYLEWIYRNGLSLLGASVLGGVTLIIAHNLGVGNDTMEVLQAVLDTNFWLATHVTCVTLGYTATFVAGFMGIAYVLMGVVTPHLTSERSQSLTKALYGTVCFAMLLSFTGTVLGGIWADQSWGRFWGWDPKENGALLIVLSNALLLHARLGGIVKARGMAVLAIGGNIVTAWSWFGVNMLGVGLHSYGFMSGALFWLSMFVISQLILMGVGCFLPTRYWWSHNVKPADLTLPPPAPKLGKDRAKAQGGTGIRPAAPVGGKSKHVRV